ncbi:MAG: DUF4178 domain-containing protein [Nostocales cyanobacterium]|nr:MAG: DUF4178 domain-containing protein [Nostocales cyanobacterium]
MYTVSIENQLYSLRPGDRVTYANINWYIKDYSTYQDSEDYQTDEWLLVSPSGTEYYLLREYEPEEDNSVTWYIANELENVHLYLPNSQENIVPRLWQEMQALVTPHPEIKLFYKSYYFDSRTEGNYESDGKTKTRITWDYWDKDYSVNLALEAFPNQKLNIYSSKVVKPTEFSEIQKSIDISKDNNSYNSGKIIELVIATLVFSVGILLMIFG